MSYSHINFHPDSDISSLLSRNEKWAKATAQSHQDMFPAQENAQNPHILWFGCSDSRVPETSILDLLPGEVFVHRNVANILPPNDLSSQSVLEFAVNYVKVKHVIVCGHTSCGGLAGALSNQSFGLLDLWLKSVKSLIAENAEELDKLDAEKRLKRLVELNVIAQVHSLLRMKNVQKAMKERGLQVHAFVYDVGCGKLRKLEVPEDKDLEVFALE